jgi:hypothetical protein
MKYVDKKGDTYEISYSQKLQREQNQIARQKNQLLFAILFVLSLCALGAGWVLFRLSSSNVLSKFLGALG